jgi:hypothetical protein
MDVVDDSEMLRGKRIHLKAAQRRTHSMTLRDYL